MSRGLWRGRGATPGNEGRDDEPSSQASWVHKGMLLEDQSDFLPSATLLVSPNGKPTVGRTVKEM
jgi:hypothetical protein